MANVNEIRTTVKELLELEAMADELKAEIESLKDSIKAVMTEQNTEVLDLGDHIIRWTSVLSNRFDTTAFKKLNPTIYTSFVKQVASRKFTIS